MLSFRDRNLSSCFPIKKDIGCALFIITLGLPILNHPNAIIASFHLLIIKSLHTQCRSTQPIPQATEAQVVCHMVLRNSGHSEIIRVCMGIFTICFRRHKYYKILNKNTLSYFHGVLLVVCAFTFPICGDFCELSSLGFLTVLQTLNSFSYNMKATLVIKK